MQSSDEIENTPDDLPPSEHQLTVDDEYSSFTSTLMSSPALSSSSSGPLFPKSNIAKPTRRRSRASKKAPMTLLNASPTNFRALVQQFTGCHTAPATALGAGWKGPINLNFAQYSYYPDQRYEPDQVQQQRRHRLNPGNEDFAPGFSSQISTNSVAAAAAGASTTTDDHEMFAAAAVDSSRPGPLANFDIDDLDMEIFPVQEPSPGDYYSASPETWHDDFWGY